MKEKNTTMIDLQGVIRSFAKTLWVTESKSGSPKNIFMNQYKEVNGLIRSSETHDPMARPSR